jgi:hypothetical protein
MGTAPLIVFIGILTLAIVDLGLVIFKGQGNSVSQFLITTAFKSPLVSFAFGATCGHLFFFMWDVNCSPDWVERILIAFCGYAFLRGGEYLIMRARRLGARSQY